MVLELKPIEGPGVDCSTLSTHEVIFRRSMIDKLCKEYVAINKIEWISADDFETLCKMDNHMLKEAYANLLQVKMLIELHDILAKLKENE
jgi:hypothetical protein